LRRLHLCLPLKAHARALKQLFSRSSSMTAYGVPLHLRITHGSGRIALILLSRPYQNSRHGAFGPPPFRYPPSLAFIPPFPFGRRQITRLISGGAATRGTIAPAVRHPHRSLPLFTACIFTYHHFHAQRRASCFLPLPLWAVNINVISFAAPYPIPDGSICATICGPTCAAGGLLCHGARTDTVPSTRLYSCGKIISYTTPTALRLRTLYRTPHIPTQRFQNALRTHP